MLRRKVHAGKSGPEPTTRSLAVRAAAACLTGLGMIATYLLISAYLRRIPIVQDAILALTTVHPWFAIALLWIVLFACLLLPFSSASLFILMGLDLYAPILMFGVAFSAGLAATCTTYFLGFRLASIISSPRLRERIDEAARFLEARIRMVGGLTFLIKAVPNPLYDAWGYACGMIRVPFHVYLPSAVAGGLIPLTFLCFGVGRFL